MTAPRKPCTQVHSDAQPKLTTKSGIASGTTTSTVQARRPGRSVRSTNHAASVPMTAQSAVTTTVSRIVFQSRSAVGRRKIRRATAEVPAPCASMSRKISGSASSTATAELAVISATGLRAARGRCRCPGGGPVRSGFGARRAWRSAITASRQQRTSQHPGSSGHHSRPASRIKEMAAVPVPSSATVIG